MSNTMRQVSARDLASFKDSIGKFIHFYVVNADIISSLSDFFCETEDETILSIMSAGLREIQGRKVLLEDAKRGDEL